MPDIFVYRKVEAQWQKNCILHCILIEGIGIVRHCKELPSLAQWPFELSIGQNFIDNDDDHMSERNIFKRKQKAKQTNDNQWNQLHVDV